MMVEGVRHGDGVSRAVGGERGSASAAGSAMREECKWGKPTYPWTGRRRHSAGLQRVLALGFFQGALLKDPKKVLVQLGQVQAGRVMKFTSAKDIKQG